MRPDERLPVFYLSHGGGPWPYMQGPMRRAFEPLERSLKALRAGLPVEPRAIIVVSGHWESEDFAVMASPHPPMVYDFGGFPEELYAIRYDAPGDPALASRIAARLESAGLPTHLDPKRGFDHGVYALLAVTHPDADVPVVQISIRRTYRPEEHLALGRAIAPFRDEGALIVGSGSSWHNLHEPRAGGSDAWDRWLHETLVDVSPEARIERLIDWEHAPNARLVHPEEDHLLPLHVVVGAAETERGSVFFSQSGFFREMFGGEGVNISSYRFG